MPRGYRGRETIEHERSEVKAAPIRKTGSLPVAIVRQRARKVNPSWIFLTNGCPLGRSDVRRSIAAQKWTEIESRRQNEENRLYAVSGWRALVTWHATESHVGRAGQFDGSKDRRICERFLIIMRVSFDSLSPWIGMFFDGIYFQCSSWKVISDTDF